MMRCPECLDDHEDGTLVCGSCHVVLHEVDPSGAIVGTAATPSRAGIRLGRFHPRVADRIADLLDDRAIAHTVAVRDDHVEVRVDPQWRDDVRAELTLTWTDILGGLEPGLAADLRATGGRAPGWFDAPEGGHVDRAGRLVVASTEDDEDEGRVVGPALLAAGAILAILGWYVADSSAVTVSGLALVLLGLFTPR